MLHNGCADLADSAAMADELLSSADDVTANLDTLLSLRLLRTAPNRPPGALMVSTFV